MNKELYMFKCSDCLKEFRTDDPNQKICPSCKKARKPHQKTRKKTSKKKPLTFAEISHIGNVYYKIHHKYLHYGDIVNLVHHTQAETCVCCGAMVYEGKHICAKCEKVGG